MSKKKPSSKEKRSNKSGDVAPEKPSIGKSISDDKAIRETIESVVIAFILAFLFRTFEAEAFVIPTGSMASTLMGRHKDLDCPECSYRYRVGASNSTAYASDGTCPNCAKHTNFFNEASNQERYADLDKAEIDLDEERTIANRAFPAYSGDRILVSKFIYDFSEPQRWDVIVFKYPGNAKINYIKRLVGKENEELMIRHGDVFVRPLNQVDAPFRIARKPPHKLLAMLNVVYDTDHVPTTLYKANWPSRWRDSSEKWQITAQGTGNVKARRFRLQNASANDTAWIRYHHTPPSDEQWNKMKYGGVKDINPQSQLITDFYSYTSAHSGVFPYWVGDLVMSSRIVVESDSGALVLDLVEGGRHYSCTIDVATGQAALSITALDGSKLSFSDDDGKKVVNPTAQTDIKGKGSYRVRLANCDDQLYLWVNDRVVKFSGPTTYANNATATPDWNEKDSGDLAPAGIGSKGVDLTVTSLQLHRDIYYLAADYISDFGVSEHANMWEYQDFGHADVKAALEHPYETRKSARDRRVSLNDDGSAQYFDKIFASRRVLHFSLGDGQFFPMGDNSPQSKDARIWGNDHFVDRKFLIGKALFVYWPHHVRSSVPLIPDFSRMRFVR